MKSKVLSSAILGIDAYIVDVKCHITGSRLPKFVIVGLPEGEVKESKERVSAAIQNSGYKLPGKLFANAQMESQDLKIHSDLDNKSSEPLRTAMDKLGLSAHAYDRILKVSRTIADLNRKIKIDSGHISEAIQYRSLDRQLWLG